MIIIMMMWMMMMMTMTDDPTRDQRAMHGGNMVKRPKYLHLKKKTLSGYLTLLRGKLVVLWILCIADRGVTNSFYLCSQWNGLYKCL